jgi:hypothetical protein
VEVTVESARSGARATPLRAPPRADSGLERPNVADRYVGLRPLGQGGAGAVYAAYDSELHRHVALKFLRRRFMGGEEGEEWRARMMREAKAMARLSHPNVVTLYDVGVSSEDGVFLAMELVEGGTLTDWLRQKGRSWSQIVAMLCDAGEGLAAAHRAGMIHRDFKLDNVLLGSDGRPRVTDFGLARTAEDHPNEEQASLAGSLPSPTPSHARAALPPATASRLRPPAPEALAKLTLTGSIMGTPGYMAPEQYTNNLALDARADIFAFCATLYRALYGERPFGGEGLKHIAYLTLQGEVSKAPKGSKVPSWLRKVVLSGLARDRDARPGSMEELLARLRAGAAKQRRRRFAAVGALGVAGVCALALRVLAAAAHPGVVRRDEPARAATTADPSESAAVGGEAAHQDPAATVESEAPRLESTASAGSASAAGSPKPAGKPALAPRPAPTTARGGARPKGAAAAASQAATPASRAAPPATGTGTRCKVESSFDGLGAPHFKKICE